MIETDTPAVLLDAPDVRLIHWDVARTPWPLERESVQCVVTSPPYYGLRAYHGVEPSVWQDDEIACLGLESTVEGYVRHLVQVFREVWRVLRADGTVWLNVGDSYCTRSVMREAGNRDTIRGFAGEVLPSWSSYAAQGRARYSSAQSRLGLKDKDLMLVPERLSIALQEDGWYIRSRIAWVKQAPMPESVSDRPTSSWEHVWLLAKSDRYYYDADAVKERAIHQGRIVRRYGDGAKNLTGASSVNDRRTAVRYCRLKATACA